MVSVIIPTLNAEAYIHNLIRVLQGQSVSCEIIIVDSSSSDNTVAIAESYGLKVIRIKRKDFDHGGTRNLAASNARGNVLVYLTQDALLEDTKCIENLVKPLSDPMVATSYGRQLPKTDANPVERFSRLFNYPSTESIKGIDDLPKLGVKTFFFSDVCSAIEKKKFEEVGGFPNRTIMNEDMFLAARLLQKGYKIAYSPKAAVYHSHDYSLSIQFKRYFDIGVFFSRNRWIRDLAKPGREGVEYLKEEIKFLIADKELKWMPFAILEAAARFLGYRIGFFEKSFPLWLKKRISYNKNFWEK